VVVKVRRKRAMAQEVAAQPGRQSVQLHLLNPTSSPAWLTSTTQQQSRRQRGNENVVTVTANRREENQRSRRRGSSRSGVSAKSPEERAAQPPGTAASPAQRRFELPRTRPSMVVLDTPALVKSVAQQGKQKRGDNTGLSRAVTEKGIKVRTAHKTTRRRSLRLRRHPVPPQKPVQRSRVSVSRWCVAGASTGRRFATSRPETPTGRIRNVSERQARREVVKCC